MRPKKEYDLQEFKHLVHQYQEEHKRLEAMTEEERHAYLAEKQRLKSLLRDEDQSYYPLIIKASSAGTLETLLAEADKAIGGN